MSSTKGLPPVPASFKPIKPYLTRAEELDRDQTREDTKVVAYYCRQFAMQEGLKLRGSDSSQEVTDFLMGLMTVLEAEKEALKDSPLLHQGKETVTQFGLDVFQRADNEDRAELADKGTAKVFYVAANFFDTLKQFGDIEPEIEAKKTYAKWKATEILKCIKEGRPIVPGGPGEEPGAAQSDDFGIPSAPSGATGGGDLNLPSIGGPAGTPPAPAFGGASGGPAAPPSYPGPSQPAAPPSYQPAPAAPRYPAAANTSAGFGASHQYVPPAPNTGPATQEQIADAIELAKFAIRALEHKQVPVGIEKLQQALQTIQRT